MECFQHICDMVFAVYRLFLIKKVIDNGDKHITCSSLQKGHWLSELFVILHFCTLGPVKYASLQFLLSKTLKRFTKVLKTLFSLLWPLTDCFISPNCMWSGGKTIFWWSTNVLFMIFSRPTPRTLRFDHSRWIPCLSFARLSHKQRKHGKLV